MVPAQQAFQVLQAVVARVLVAVVNLKSLGDLSVCGGPDSAMEQPRLAARARRVVSPGPPVVAHAIECVDGMLREVSERLGDDRILHLDLPAKVSGYLSWIPENCVTWRSASAAASRRSSMSTSSRIMCASPARAP